MNFLSTIRKRYYLILALFFFLLTFAVYYLTGEGGATPYDNFVRLADAFLNGRLYLTADVPRLELVPLEGKHYVVPPPFPAILILPVVAIWELDTL
jgi:hypothetical protein